VNSGFNGTEESKNSTGCTILLGIQGILSSIGGNLVWSHDWGKGGSSKKVAAVRVALLWHRLIVLTPQEKEKVR